MNRDEKILMLQILLEDMRGSFPLAGWGDRRMTQAHALATELGLEAHAARIVQLAEDDDYRDGRHFRVGHEYGGYEGMGALHPLKSTFHDKSVEFRRFATGLLEFPEYRFEDWDQEPVAPATADEAAHD